MVSIKLGNVTKKFGNTTAVDNANLTIFDKEFFCFVGPSGCGKTTTLRLIAGLENPTKGSIYFGDELVNEISPRERNIAMVFQTYALYPTMDVYGNIEFPLKIGRVPKNERKAKVEKLAELLGIETLLSRKPHQLSGGQQQRAALGRALIREPRVFLLDEPLSNLDAKLRVSMRSELRKLQQKLQITTIYVTHDQVEAMTMSDRVGLMSGGKILQVGPPLELYNNPTKLFVADFLGTPPINLIPCSLIEKKGTLLLDVGDFALRVPSSIEEPMKKRVSSELILGMRPEDVKCDKHKTPDSIKGVVYFIEALGNSQVIHVKIGEQIVLSLEDLRQEFKVGEDVLIKFDMQKIHIFDKESEDCLI